MAELCVFCHLSKFMSTVVPAEAAEVVMTVSRGSPVDLAVAPGPVGAVVLTIELLPPAEASWPPLQVVEATTTEAEAGPRSFISIVELYCDSIPELVVDGMLLSRSAGSGWPPAWACC